jgi:hypothetical protein
MDWLTFTDHVIGHLAWPLVVAGLVVFLSLRHRVAFDTLLHRVRKARVGPFEAELDEAKAEADRANLPPPSMKPPPDTEVLQRPESNEPEVWFGYFIKLAEQDPLASVFHVGVVAVAWAAVGWGERRPGRSRVAAGVAVLAAGRLGWLAGSVA